MQKLRWQMLDIELLLRDGTLPHSAVCFPLGRKGRIIVWPECNNAQGQVRCC